MSQTLPRSRPYGALLAGGLVLAVALVGFALPHHGPLLPVRMAPSPLQMQRQLRFSIGPDAVVIADAASGARLGSVPTEKQGFVSGMIHGVAAIRRQNGLDLDAPFTVSLYRDGRLILRDPLTNTAIDLESFGPTNAMSFARFLPRREASR